MSKLHPKYDEPSVPRTQMAGKGAPRQSIFGVIGKTKVDSYTKSLGGLVTDTKIHSYRDPSFKPTGYNTENGILGHNASAVAKTHYSQVPYAGRYMVKQGPTA
jgi:hypothetical protein